MSDSHPDIAIANPDIRQQPRADDADGKLMSAAQAAELLCLSQRAEEPEAYSDDLTRFEADNRIKLLKRKLDG